MSPIVDIVRELDNRRRKMRLSCYRLAKMCGLSCRTVQRVLSGEADTSVSSLSAIAGVLGARLGIKHRRNPASILKNHALRKARDIVRMAQASAGIEGLAVSESVAEAGARKIAGDLIRGPAIRLWG